MNRLGAIAVVCGALLACGHMPRAKVGRILGQAQELNTRNEQAVLSRFLRAGHATALKPEVQWLLSPEDPWSDSDRRAPMSGRLGGELQLRDRRQEVRLLHRDWDDFNRDLEHQGHAEVMTGSGRRLLLVLSTESVEQDWAAAGHRHYARSESGRLLVIETHLRPLRRHHLTSSDFCKDSSVAYPSPSRWPVMVFEGSDATDYVGSRRVQLTFEGEGISTRGESCLD